MKKRLLTIVLAMVMVVAMVPTMVFADSIDVAKIGNVKYQSLQAAIDAAQSGQTVIVIADIDIAKEELIQLGSNYKTLFKVKGKSITVDMNGRKIYGEYDKEPMLVGLFSTEKNGHLILTGNGTVDIKAKKTVYGLLVNYESGSSITVQNGTFILDKASDSIAYTGGNEDVIVNGGTFKLGNIGTGSNGSPWIFNAGGKNTAHIIVNGGTFNGDVNHQYYPFEVDIPKEKALKKNNDGTWTIFPAGAYVMEYEQSGQWYSREIGYATLKEAVEVVNVRGKAATVKNENEKITLLKDCQIRDTLHFEKDTEIVLNDKKIIWEGKDDTPIVSFDEDVVISEFEPSRVGYDFKGWYTDKNYENEWTWDFDNINTQTKATQNVTTLYAKWTEIPVKPEASPATGDNSMAPFAVAGLVMAAMAAVVATRRRTN